MREIEVEVEEEEYGEEGDLMDEEDLMDESDGEEGLGGGNAWNLDGDLRNFLGGGGGNIYHGERAARRNDIINVVEGEPNPLERRYELGLDHPSL